MVIKKSLAPGIDVYSVGIDKTVYYYNILKTYSDPFLTMGSVIKKNENGEYYSKIDEHVRNCKIFSTSELRQCHESDPLRILMGEVQQEMTDIVNQFCQKYQYHSVIPNHDLIMMRYAEGEFFNYHNDDCPSIPRTVSAVMYFNSDYEGGELGFKHFNIEYSPEPGDCVVFCSAFPYMHRVKKITKGARYAAVNWYRYV